MCKCAYMRGLAIWAPTQTISLFWKCSLQSSGADRSQEQRGKWALASFLLSLRDLQSLSLRRRFGSPLKQDYLRRAEVRRNQGGRRGVVMGTEQQLTAGPSCPSFPSPSSTHMRCQQRTCTQPGLCPGGLYGQLMVCSPVQDAGIRNNHTLAGAEFTERSGLAELKGCMTPDARYLHSAILFFSFHISGNKGDES